MRQVRFRTALAQLCAHGLGRLKRGPRHCGATSSRSRGPPILVAAVIADIPLQPSPTQPAHWDITSDEGLASLKRQPSWPATSWPATSWPATSWPATSWPATSWPAASWPAASDPSPIPLPAPEPSPAASAGHPRQRRSFA